MKVLGHMKKVSMIKKRNILLKRKFKTHVPGSCIYVGLIIQVKQSMVLKHFPHTLIHVSAHNLKCFKIHVKGKTYSIPIPQIINSYIYILLGLWEVAPHYILNLI